MRLIKMFGLASLAAVAAMAFVGATSASALTNTVLCKVHTGLLCPSDQWQTHDHLVDAPTSLNKLLSSIVDVLCLDVLVDNTPLALGKPQVVHTLTLKFENCGTGAAHNNCKVEVEEAPLSNLLKTGLNEGVVTNTSGRTRLLCSNLGINCVYDLAGSEFAAGAGHLTAEATPTTELGGKFFCPDNGFLDGLLESLLPTYVLQ